MTDDDWRQSGEPARMLTALGSRASPRKLRLFACACCQRIAPLLTDPRSREAVRVAERLAEGQPAATGYAEAQPAVADAPTQKARYAAEAAAFAIDSSSVLGGRPLPPAVRVWYAARKSSEYAVQAAACTPDAPAGDPLAERDPDAEAAAKRAQAQLLRDIFGPRRRAVALDPALRRWQDGVAVRMARAVYEGGTFEALPILADALEDAGCADDAILGHLRGPGPHVRGCWVLDLLLGKG